MNRKLVSDPRSKKGTRTRGKHSSLTLVVTAKGVRIVVPDQATMAREQLEQQLCGSHRSPRSKHRGKKRGEPAGHKAQPTTAPVQPVAVPAEQAAEFFLRRVKQLPGVLLVEASGQENAPPDSIRVYVQSRLSEEADRIYDLILELGRTYPEAGLDIWVTEARNPAALVQVGGNAA